MNIIMYFGLVAIWLCIAVIVVTSIEFISNKMGCNSGLVHDSFALTVLAVFMVQVVVNLILYDVM